MKLLDDPRIDDGVFYPESDGLPMAENTVQWDWIALIKSNLTRIFRERKDVLIAADNFIYPVKGKPSIVQAPDVYVAIGRPAGPRGSYKVWREGNQFPQVTIEVLSPSNTASEMVKKRGFYERHGVVEYYLIDPDRLTLSIWVRRGRELEEVDEPIGYISPLTGMQFLRDDHDELIVFGPDGKQFFTLNDAEDRELRSLAELRKERRIASAERKRANAAVKVAEAETQRADAVALANAKLAAKLRELGIDPDTV